MDSVASRHLLPTSQIQLSVVEGSSEMNHMLAATKGGEPILINTHQYSQKSEQIATSQLLRMSASRSLADP